MEENKPKALDIIRLIIAIILICIGVLAVFYTVAGTIGMFTSADEEDTISGLVYLYIIPIFVIGIVFAFVGVKWIKKYNMNKNIPLIERKTDIATPIVISILAIFFLSYASVPLVVYYVFDFIEAIMKNNLVNKSKINNTSNNSITSSSVYVNSTSNTNNMQSENNVSESSNIDNGKHYCKNCGHEVDYRYARFCEYCGSEIEYKREDR